LKEIGKSIEKLKIKNLVTLLRLPPLVGFPAMAGKIQSTRANFP
jgi:hypothetical protein